MRKILIFVILMLTCTITFAQRKKDGTPDMRFKENKQIYGSMPKSQTYNNNNRYQQGYTKKNGTQVDGHYKTNKNNTNHDNYSTSPNYNPYNNQSGSRAKDYSNESYNYGKGKVINKGSNGGQYYLNDNGNKTYVPKRK